MALPPEPERPESFKHADPTGWAGHRIVTWVRRLGPAGPLTFLVVALPGIGGLVLLGLLTRIAPWLREHTALGLVMYFAGFCLLGGVAILPSYACSGLGGWTFGLAVGFPAAMASLTAAAVVGYLWAKRLAGSQVSDMIQNDARARAVYQALLGSGFWKALLVISLIRVPPVPPFAATNLLLAAARVPLPLYILGTLIGIAPRTAFVVYLFAGLKTLDFGSFVDVRTFAIKAAVTLGVLAILSYLARHAVARVTK